MKFINFYDRINKNHENLIIPNQNYQNHEIHKIPRQNHKDNGMKCQNYENHEKLIIPRQKNEIHEILEFDDGIMKFMKI